MTDINKIITENKKQIMEKRSQISKLEIEISSLQNNIQQLVIKNKLYNTDFTPYIGKYFTKITLVIEEDGMISSTEWCNGYYKVDNNGHIDVYSMWDTCHTGINWDEKQNSYAWYSSHTNQRKPVTIIGFYNEELEKD